MSIALLALVVFTPVRIAFELAVLPWWLYLVGLGLSIVPIVVMEIAKLIEHIMERNKEREHEAEIKKIEEK